MDERGKLVVLQLLYIKNQFQSFCGFIVLLFCVGANIGHFHIQSIQI